MPRIGRSIVRMWDFPLIGSCRRSALAPRSDPQPGVLGAGIPPAAASASAVLDAYLRALVADDCKTAHGLASSTLTYGNGELCGDVHVSSFSVSKSPANPSPDEVIYASVLITGGSEDGTIPKGKTTWFYDLTREGGVWKLASGGSGP